MTRLLNNGGSTRLNISQTMSPHKIPLYKSEIKKILS
jgi:hypothetical protein